MANSTKGKKPQKPRPDFPLFPHASGRWAKKVRGKFEYFGKVADDPAGDAALEKWLAEKDYLLAGRRPPTGDGLTVGALCDRWLTIQEQRYTQGEISYRSYVDYKAVTDRLVRVFRPGRRVDDLQPDDFQKFRDDLAKDYALQSLPKRITISRSVFKYAVESRWIDAPVIFGPAFKPPSRKTLKRQRVASGPKMFEAEEIRDMLDQADVQMKATILLGINCGFGPADIGRLTVDAIDFQDRFIDHARGKTGEPRRCPIWKRTVAALQAAIKARKQPKNEQDAKLVFITKYGQSWHKEDCSSTPLSAEFKKFMEDCAVYRSGRGFYALRHTFETIAGDSRDQVAVNAVMGHVDATMAGVYRQRIEDDRLVDVAKHVERWLFPAKTKKR